MSGKYFVDTNILMYAHDITAGEKYHRAKVVIEELWRAGSGIVSTQVLAGTLRQFEAKGKAST